MISRPHNTIFIHIPKTGGQSVERMLLKDLGLTWKEKSKAGLVDPSLRKPQTASHYTLNDYVRFTDVNSMHSFCIVRNIYDRLISMYRYLRKFKFIKGSFEEFVLKKLPEIMNDPEWYYFIRPQADFLIGVEDILEFSNFTEDINRIRKKLGIKSELPHVNKSSGKLPAEYTNKMKRKVECLYYVDFLQLPESCKD